MSDILALGAFRYHVTNLWFRSLRRRSQKSTLTWERMLKLAADWLPSPQILQPWPNQRFSVKHKGRSRMREFCKFGSVRGAPSNGRPYRDWGRVVRLWPKAPNRWPQPRRPTWCRAGSACAADASVLMPAVRRCHLSRSAAAADQRLFAMDLPAAELTLHAAVHSASTSERAMLLEALDKLGPDDVLLLDRGYPAAWLINLLNDRGIRFIMRCDTTGSGSWTELRTFMHGDQAEAVVQLTAPKLQDATDCCSALAPTVRLVRNTSTGARLRVLMTNLPADQASVSSAGCLLLDCSSHPSVCIVLSFTGASPSFAGKHHTLSPLSAFSALNCSTA